MVLNCGHHGFTFTKPQRSIVVFIEKFQTCSFLQYYCIIVKILKTIHHTHLYCRLLDEIIFLGRDVLLDVHNHLISFLCEGSAL